MGAVDTLLAEHVNLRVTCVDRVGIAGYIRALQLEGGAGAGFERATFGS